MILAKNVTSLKLDPHSEMGPVLSTPSLGCSQELLSEMEDNGNITAWYGGCNLQIWGLWEPADSPQPNSRLEKVSWWSWH